MTAQAGGAAGPAAGAAWAAAGAAVALAAVAAAMAAAGVGPEHGAGAQEDGAGQVAGTASEEGEERRADPDVVMPSKSSRPGCEVDGACYIPAEAAVAAGGSLTWRNDDVAFHTVTSGEYGSADGAFDSGHLDPGEDYTVQFAEAGAVEYHCTLHPWMHGRVVVVPADKAADEAAGGAPSAVQGE